MSERGQRSEMSETLGEKVDLTSLSLGCMYVRWITVHSTTHHLPTLAL